MSMSDDIAEPFIYAMAGENPNAPGSHVTIPPRIQFKPFEDPLIPILTRIADALDRAYPLPAEKAPGKLKPGVADYHYEDPQTLELRQLRDGKKNTPSN